MSEWGKGGKKTVEELYWEVVTCRESVLTGLKTLGRLKRVTRFVKIRLAAEISGVRHILFSRMQFRHDGHVNEEKRLPLRKLQWLEQYVGSGVEVHHEKCLTEDCAYTEDWRAGARRALEERFKLEPEWQKQHLEEVPGSHSFRVEDVRSDGYPGLCTLYCIHEVTLRVIDPTHPDAKIIGLPMGVEFVTTDGEYTFEKLSTDEIPMGAQMNIWAWLQESAAPAATSGSQPRQSGQSGHSGRMSGVRSRLRRGTTGSQCGKKLEGAAPHSKDEALLLIRRVPLPATSAKALATMQVSLRMGSMRPPNAALWSVLKGRTTDWTRVQQMARSITDPDYTLRDFNEDLLAFPELNLYLLEKLAGIGAPGTAGGASGSGRGLGDEYQRTLGAFFAIYWLLRLPVDGKDGFCFGVDDNWAPLRPSATTAGDARLTPLERREVFMRDGKWDLFRQLLLSAGILRKSGWSATKVNEKRLVSLLALTAIHDIMKINVFLPVVQPEHAPYHGYNVGDVIADHDKALGYVMDHYPEMLPSFRELDPAERRAVQFTQCSLCFNHGWFVQAEAPPGATLTKFREVVARDQKSRFGKSDIAFYFVHWLTDLAGAEPTPLGGCEKFVTKFPLAVLNSFLHSFEFVETVAVNTETETMERYLKERWAAHEPSLGPVPSGDGAVARMRLACMAQTNAARILEAFESIDEGYRDILSREMARSGCRDQAYSSDIAPADVRDQPAGPAFLIYYGPALLQSLGSDDPVRRLGLLAEVYRCARELWPLDPAEAHVNVIVRVDVIKSLSTRDILEAADGGAAWALVKQNESEGVVEKRQEDEAGAVKANEQNICFLDISRLR